MQQSNQREPQNGTARDKEGGKGGKNLRGRENNLCKLRLKMKLINLHKNKKTKRGVKDKVTTNR